MRYSIGYIFKDQHDIPYLLAQTNYYKVSLIDLNNGNRHADPVAVKSPYQITENEMAKIQGNLTLKLVCYDYSAYYKIHAKSYDQRVCPTAGWTDREDYRDRQCIYQGIQRN